MTKAEFEMLTGRKVTDAEFDAANEVYMAAGGIDKKDFAKEWAKSKLGEGIFGVAVVKAIYENATIAMRSRISCDNAKRENEKLYAELDRLYAEQEEMRAELKSANEERDKLLAMQAEAQEQIDRLLKAIGIERSVGEASAATLGKELEAVKEKLHKTASDRERLTYALLKTGNEQAAIGAVGRTVVLAIKCEYDMELTTDDKRYITRHLKD